MVDSHLSPNRFTSNTNRICYGIGNEEVVRYWRYTDGSPGEFKHFKSLLPLSAAIYSQQTAGSQVIQYFPSFLVAADSLS